MRAHRITEWTLEPPYARRLRQLNRTPGGTYETFKKGIENRDPAICVNVIVGLIKVTCYLLSTCNSVVWKKISCAKEARERMARARLAPRAKRRQRP